MKRVTVKQTHVKHIKQQNPLILEEAIHGADKLHEGEIIALHAQQGEFLAQAYTGRQNKGMGWVLTFKQEDTIDQGFFKQKLLTAINKRRSYYQAEETTAFRVFNGEGDGIGGLIIDYFEGYYVIQWYSEGIYAFKDWVIQVFDELGDYQGIYEKKRFDTKGQYVEGDDFVKGTRGEFPLIVKENGMNYAVYLNDGAMVGIFLDQRDVRKALRDKYAKGKHVLNTFSYTGAFSVAAALGGAAKTTSVDLAKRSKSKTIEQFSVNEVDFEQQDIIVMDVFDYFKYAKRKKLQFDVVVLDPPSFARSKKRTFRTAKDYPELIENSIDLLEKDGVIIASTNTASFGMKKFKEMIQRGFQAKQKKYTILEEFSLPGDFAVNKHFKQGDYLKVIVIQVKD
ncbi:class I SAM-dependent rRNA methyltransferase [Oceanobacillus oncorhynchi]|uniref:Ribosomal RNA large subunit methyltransferase I n=1 Tax=Oceanobacillus oncorhynchi TaxID=545501 RepID=A0A0A1MGZ0_9BACI|nr:class I SAM-dependent rRNA methyltransferase [Oceanobacillus oncorhynchi]MDM8100311.1 class I SAM-dependent rRNA methyltransferase [Oceanobacillus oncorhynchi]UUI40875.1 class I SAM-dependent rRNA methyltransferase [Oceanobacillus oncorhynchi]CEI82313.1 Ribosomal RNA large subunit methyltransferase I [Oceanobacillus oncorhynchi]